MNNIFLKNNKVCFTKLKRSRGFVILFAVTIAAIMLSIAIGVANIAYNEIRFTTSVRDTNDAIFAADTGIECALLYDKDDPTKNAFIGTAIMSCVGNPITLNGSAPNWDFVIPGLGSSGQSCAKVAVNKLDVSPYTTTITSRGYNTGNASCNSTSLSRIERELIVTFGAPPPIPIKVTIPSAGLTNNGFISFSDVGSVDNNTGTQAWHTDNLNPVPEKSLQIGLGGPEALVRARLYVNTSHNGIYSVQYYNGSAWVDAVTNFAPSSSGWNEITWPNVGAHDLWKLRLTNNPTPSDYIWELEMYK